MLATANATFAFYRAAKPGSTVSHIFCFLANRCNALSLCPHKFGPVISIDGAAWFTNDAMGAIREIVDGSG